MARFSAASSSLSLAAILLGFLTLIRYGQCTTRPIIGVLAQELYNHKNGSTITASYVKAVEASGARVVPIFIGKNKGYYIRLLSELNGVIFPGGSVDFHARGGYAEAGQYIFEEAIYLNNHGRHFPILGVCQGLQLLAFISNNKTDLLTKCTGTYNTALNLNFTKGSANSSLYGNASRSDLAALAKFNLTVNQHEWCLTEKNLSHFRLDRFWKVLTLNNDAKGMPFISSMESSRYPFVGVQFHPEKVAYEWNPKQNTPHSPLAVRVNRLFYDWLIYQARFSRNGFNSTSIEDRFVIYNFSPTFTGRKGGYSEQVYFFRW
uniref:folate gamma-glutamyl hydrolase n=1 Tax=Panstrongylus lignarius TaxID=156445 RepID=A0A224XG52_9HEMI